EEVIDGYLDFLDHNEKASAKEVRKVEGAMRKVFACAADALDKIENIKPLKQKANFPHVELLDISHNEVLPSVGYVDKQVEPSIIANELQAEAVRLPEHADFIQALQNLVTHYSRLAYCFLRIKLVREIHNILFGKIIAKAKAMAILEKERIKQVAVLQAQGVLGAHASAVSSQRRDGYSLEH
ncbi:MAG: hypothetical protein KDD76_04825, partial [Rickettsiales bacterium]|nr:hypothetical protein [Rickettsiales bacterium]